MQYLITLESRVQASAKGGTCKFFSVPPASNLVRVTDFEYRYAVTNAPGSESSVLHSTAQGARCPTCPKKPRIKGGRHFHNCMVCGRSTVHNAVRDAAAHVTRKAVGPHVPIVTEPRRYVVGYASDHRGGPDILVIDAKTVLDVKPTNPHAKKNQRSLSKDIR